MNSPKINYQRRQGAIADLLTQGARNALFVTNLTNVRYLCGFTGSAGVLAFARGKWAFFSDGRYEEQAAKQVQGVSVHIGSGPPLAQATRWVGALLRRMKKPEIAVEAEHISLLTQKRLRADLRSILGSAYRLVPSSDLVERLRVIKEPAEIKLMRDAAALASSIFDSVRECIQLGISENDVAAELEYRARRAGAEKMSFETIVASGRNSALPHARPSTQKLGRGFVVLDYGVILGGYCSDMTRTVCVGRADRYKQNVYSAVLEAQLAGIAAVRAGVEGQQVDAAARDVLRKHKLDRYFTHSLGHGVGLDIHEAPRLAKGQKQKLQAGMVVTIEPGVYIPDKGGVRIEDTVVVTENGCEVLTPTTKELIIC